jgi:CBS domain containing-hemolysin-like protein
VSEVIGNSIIILLLVFANAFFVTAEFAFVRIRAHQIDKLVSRGHKGAVVAQHMIEHLDSYLSATQLGITLASLGLGWVGEPLLADMIRDPLAIMGVGETALHAISFGISFGILTFLHIVLGELAPKSLAIQHTVKTTLVVSIPLRLFYQIFKPIIWFLNSAANIFLRAIGIPPANTASLLHSPEELQLIVDEGAKSGVINKMEQELISSIFEFSNTTAKEIMIPRPDVVAIADTTARDVLIRIVTEEGYSRMPVYKDSIDNIIGIMYTKDLINLLEHRDLIVLHDIIRPAHFVPDQIKISKLMRDMQERKISMAIVVDEFGGTEGIITMEDILEEIVGEIHDEYDEVLKDIEQVADGSALVNARIGIDDFNEKFGVEVPEDPEYETLNGFLYKITGRIPEVHEEVKYGNLHFTVMKKSQRRIRQVKVRKLRASEGA